MDERGLRRRLADAYGTIAGILEDPGAYRTCFSLPPEEARRQSQEVLRRRDLAVAGRRRERDYITGLYGTILEHRREASLWEECFEAPGCFWLQLEILLAGGGFGALLDRNADRAAIGMEEVASQGAACPPGDRRALFSSLVFAQENGQDVLENLQYAGVDEIGATRPDYVYVVYRGRKIRLRGLSFPGANALYRVQKKAARRARPQYDFNRPALTTDKLSGSRVTVAGYLATPGPRDLYFNERLFQLKRITLEALETTYRTIDRGIYELLCLNQRGKGSFLVTGAEMGVGKTTFLSALIEKIPDHWGIGILDTQNELRAHANYPDKNILTVIENPNLTVEEGFRYLLKTSRDVILVGEITRQEEMESLMQGALRLNAGIGGTIHASRAALGIQCCRTLLRGGGADRYREEDLAATIDLVIHMARHPRHPERILVEEVAEVRPPAELPPDAGDGELQRAWYRRRLQPRSYRIETLVSYDYRQETWVYRGTPSEPYLEKLGRYVPDAERRCFQEAWEARL